MNSTRISEIKALVEKEFGNLNLIQLNWKPAPGKWSIGQCLEHLIIYNSKYLEILYTVSSGKYNSGFWANYNPMNNYTGKQMIKNLGPIILKK